MLMSQLLLLIVTAIQTRNSQSPRLRMPGVVLMQQPMITTAALGVPLEAGTLHLIMSRPLPSYRSLPMVDGIEIGDDY